LGTDFGMRGERYAKVLELVNQYDSISISTRRRIAWRLLPYLALLFVVAYLDRVNLSYSADVT
jgi:hypothetical protein